jgi:putative membrane protein
MKTANRLLLPVRRSHFRRLLRYAAVPVTLSRIPFPSSECETSMSRWNGVLRRRGRERQSAFFKTLHDCVHQIRPRTSAALTVVLRGSSGSYRDVAFLIGAVVAWLGLILILLLPQTVHPWSVPLDVLGLFLLAAWLCIRLRLQRWLTTRRRRRRQARTAAQALFVEEGVAHTKDAQGVLIYWSRLERHIEVVADVGILTHVPPQDWNALVFALRRVPYHPHPGATFVEQLRGLGELLAKHLPPVPHAGPTPLRIGGGR